MLHKDSDEARRQKARQGQMEGMYCFIEYLHTITITNRINQTLMVQFH